MLPDPARVRCDVEYQHADGSALQHPRQIVRLSDLHVAPLDALAWLADGTVPVADMISHRLPLASLEEALQLVEKRESIKILLYPEC